MRRFLADWSDDIAPAWRKTLQGVEPDYDAIAEQLTLNKNEPIFPGRRGHALESLRLR